jgi:hypothetical protein
MKDYSNLYFIFGLANLIFILFIIVGFEFYYLNATILKYFLLMKLYSFSYQYFINKSYFEYNSISYLLYYPSL